MLLLTKVLSAAGDNCLGAASIGVTVGGDIGMAAVSTTAAGDNRKCAGVCCMTAAGIAVALYPGSWGEGEERAWYTPFTHALNHPNFPGIQILTIHIHDTMTSKKAWTFGTSKPCA